uniref:Uncharacterized protein n=1 Tax=Plectus sambesii TaxID=2011161 RepID=A0A914W8K5_9BILA
MFEREPYGEAQQIRVPCPIPCTSICPLPDHLPLVNVQRPSSKKTGNVGFNGVNTAECLRDLLERRRLTGECPCPNVCTYNSDPTLPANTLRLQRRDPQRQSVDDPLNELAASPLPLAACAAEQDPVANVHLYDKEIRSVNFGHVCAVIGRGMDWRGQSVLAFSPLSHALGGPNKIPAPTHCCGRGAELIELGFLVGVSTTNGRLSTHDRYNPSDYECWRAVICFGRL